MLAIAETDTDEGLAAGRRGLARLCLATREVKPIDEMIRFVAAPDGRVVPDIDRKLPGRGAWVTAKRAAVELALRNGAFNRAFRNQAKADESLAEVTERLLERSALEALSLANKAGLIITGTSKLERALADEEIAALIRASDAAADGSRKIDALVRGRLAGTAEPALINAFSGEQLDLALGRSNVVHAALLAHSASAGFLARYLRLDHWRGGGPAGQPGISSARTGKARN